MKNSSSTLCHVLNHIENRSSNATALKTKRGSKWVNITWQQYYDDILKCASGLHQLGAQPGTKIALMANTRYEWSVCDYAIMGQQCVTVPIYQTVTQSDLQYILQNSQAEFLILEGRSLIKTFLQIADSCPHLKKVICMDGESPADSRIISWPQLLEMGAKHKDNFKDKFKKLCESTTPHQVATLIYTSGTTGLPKGVVLAHEQIMSEVGEAFPYLGVTEKDTLLTFLPYAHVLGRIEHWGHLLWGYTLAYAESIDRLRENMPEIQPTIMVAVPRIFEKVYTAVSAQMNTKFVQSKLAKWAVGIGLQVSEHRLKREPIPVALAAQYTVAKSLVLDKVKALFGGRLRFAVSGGAPLARDIALFFHACDILILEGYGLTETTAAVFVNAPFDYNFGSVGKPVGDVQVKIAEDGEILVKSKKVMKEYYQDPQATASVMTDGWFHTGDIGEILPSGDLRITDRKKDLIKTAGGKYVAPQRLENLLKANSFLSNVLIHGDQKKYIVALITLDKSYITKYAKEKNISFQDYASLTQHPIIQDMVRKGIADTNSQLASFEAIKRFLILPEDFTVESGELTPSLKVKRKVLDQKYKTQIDSLYS